MKHRLAILLSCVAALSGLAQGFINLGFESANLIPVPPGQFGGPVLTVDGIPRWTAFLGATPLTQILQNNFTLGNASIDILGPNWLFGGIIEGQYTVVLQPGLDPFGSGQYVGASISETALVPANAQSLQFKAAAFSGFSVSLGGQVLSIFPIETGANYTLYGANLPPSFAGQNETLTITALPGPNTANYFDSFVFSPTSVPEPSTWALLALGGAAFAFMARRRK